MNKKVDKKTLKKGLLPYLFLLIIMLGIFYVFTVMNKVVHTLSYNEFIEKLDENKIAELHLIPRGNGHIYEVDGTLKDYKKNEKFEATLPLRM